MADELVCLLVVYAKTKVAVVDEDLCPFAQVAHEARVRYGNHFACGAAFGVAHDGHDVAFVVLYGLVGSCGAHLGSFGVDEDGEVARHFAHVVDDALHACGVLVGCVEAYHVHACVVEALDESYVATHIGDGCYNLGLLIHGVSLV